MAFKRKADSQIELENHLDVFRTLYVLRDRCRRRITLNKELHAESEAFLASVDAGHTPAPIELNLDAVRLAPKALPGAGNEPA